MECAARQQGRAAAFKNARDTSIAGACSHELSYHFEE